MKLWELEEGKTYVRTDDASFDKYIIYGNQTAIIVKGKKSFFEFNIDFVKEAYFEECVKSVDWSKVQIDTKILVRSNNYDPWEKSYFAGYGENGEVFTFINGSTSFSSNGYKIPCMYAKLYTEE